MPYGSGPQPGPQIGTGPRNYKMCAGGDTTRFLGMWLVHYSHGDTVHESNPKPKLSRVDRSVAAKGLGTTALMYIFQTFIVDIKDCL